MFNLRFGLFLASGSPARLLLLKSIGVMVEKSYSPSVNEDPIKNEKVRDYSRRVTLSKVKERKNVGKLTLAADTAVVCGTRLLHKTEDRDIAKTNLEALSGRRHRVYTTVCLIDPNENILTRQVLTFVQFKSLNKKEIEEYLDTNEWKGKAGSYAIQGIGSIFIKKINGSHSSVIGLPVCEVYKMLLNYKCSQN